METISTGATCTRRHKSLLPYQPAPMRPTRRIFSAAKVVGMFSKETLESEPIVAEVDEKSCVGCLNCVRVCPFKAIEEKTLENPKTGEQRIVASVNEGVCEGCGTCAAACPSGCISLRGFTDEQILAELDVLTV